MRRLTGRHTTGTYRALRLGFRVSSSDPLLTGYLEECLADASAAPTESSFTYEAAWDAEVAFHPDALLTDLNLRAIEASRDLLLLHAGACASGPAAVVLCGPSGSGKSTLTTGLVASGLDYLTDETVAVRPDDLTIIPWPKPITLKRGSWAVHPRLAPTPGSLAERFTTDLWHVPSRRIRPDAVGQEGCRARAVVLPTYRGGAGVQLLPVTRAEAAMTLFEQTSYGADHGPGVVSLLRRLLEPCSTHRLLFDDLDGAVEAIRSLLP